MKDTSIESKQDGQPRIRKKAEKQKERCYQMKIENRRTATSGLKQNKEVRRTLVLNGNKMDSHTRSDKA